MIRIVTFPLWLLWAALSRLLGLIIVIVVGALVAVLLVVLQLGWTLLRPNRPRPSAR